MKTINLYPGGCYGWLATMWKMKMDYTALLNHSHQMSQISYELTKCEYLSSYIFDFATYDAEMDELFVKKALEVALAITNRSTFDYIEDDENYKWYLIMCNLPFFYTKLEWGTSIRGAWWDLYGEKQFTLESCGIWEGDQQILKMSFNEKQWADFIKAMVDFTNG